MLFKDIAKKKIGKEPMNASIYLKKLFFATKKSPGFEF